MTTEGVDQKHSALQYCGTVVGIGARRKSLRNDKIDILSGHLNLTIQSLEESNLSFWTDAHQTHGSSVLDREIWST